MTDETAWLEWRRQGIGASDIAAIIGESPWTSPFALWANKTGQTPDNTNPSEMMIFGKRFEQIAAPWFHDETGLHVAGEQTWVTHPNHPWAKATVDGFVYPDNPDDFDTDTPPLGTFEAKVDFRHGPDVWDAEIPIHYQCQAQWQMWVTQTARCWFAVLHSFGQFRVYQLDRNDDDIRLLVDAAETFWVDHVLTGTPPPVDGSDATSDAIATIWPTHQPAVIHEADSSLVELLRQRTLFKSRIAADKDVLAEIDNQIAVAVGDAEQITVAGIAAWSYKAQQRTTPNLAAFLAAQLFVLRLAGYNGPGPDTTGYTTTTEFRTLRQLKGSKSK